MVKKLVVCATPSGVPLASKVCKELTVRINKEFEHLKNKLRDSVEEDTFRRICLIKEINRRQFGTDEFKTWPIEWKCFSSSEAKPVIHESVRGADVFLIHSSYEPRISAEELLKIIKSSKSDEEQISAIRSFELQRRVPENDKIAEMYIDAIKRDGMASRVILISPYCSNSRQDHRRGREGHTLRTQIRIFEKCGVDAFYFIDTHSQATTGFSETHIDNFHPTKYLISKFKIMYPDYKDKFIMFSPDAGAFKRIEHITEHYIQMQTAIGFKIRDYANVNSILNSMVFGISKNSGKYAVIVDDIIDSGGTMERHIKTLCNEYGIKGVVAIASHALLSGEGLKRMEYLYREGMLMNLITTDSVPRDDSFIAEHPWYVVVSLSPHIANFIYNTYMNEAVSDVYLDD